MRACSRRRRCCYAAWPLSRHLPANRTVHKGRTRGGTISHGRLRIVAPENGYGYCQQGTHRVTHTAVDVLAARRRGRSERFCFCSPLGSWTRVCAPPSLQDRPHPPALACLLCPAGTPPTDPGMIDQDYAELLGRSPPTGELLEWTFPASALANTFVSLLIGTPALCLALYVAAGEGDHVGGSVEFRVSLINGSFGQAWCCGWWQCLCGLWVVRGTEKDRGWRGRERHKRNTKTNQNMAGEKSPALCIHLHRGTVFERIMRKKVLEKGVEARARPGVASSIPNVACMLLYWTAVCNPNCSAAVFMNRVRAGHEPPSTPCKREWRVVMYRIRTPHRTDAVEEAFVKGFAAHLHTCLFYVLETRLPSEATVPQPSARRRPYRGPIRSDPKSALQVATEVALLQL